MPDLTQQLNYIKDLNILPSEIDLISHLKITPESLWDLADHDKTLTRLLLTLTTRQLEVLIFLIRTVYRTGEIATKMGISPETLKVHYRMIKKHFGYTSIKNLRVDFQLHQVQPPSITP